MSLGRIALRRFGLQGFAVSRSRLLSPRPMPLRCLSSTAQAPPSNPLDSDAAPQVDPQTLADSLDVATTDLTRLDPDLSTLGWGPVDLCTSLIDVLHVSTGLAWWESIVLTTVLLRLAVLPLNIRQMRSALRMKHMQPELMAIQTEMKEKPAKSIEEQQLYAQRFKKLQEKHGVSIMGTMLGPLSQIPIFLTMFWTLRRMAEEYPSLAEGGTLWFNNLAEADPTYGLPILCSLSFWAMTEFGSADAPAPSGNEAQQDRMKNLMRGMAVVMLPITASQPSAVAVYWATTNVAGILQSGMMKIPAVKNALGISLKENIEVPKPVEDMMLHSTNPVEKRSRKSRDRSAE